MINQQSIYLLFILVSVFSCNTSNKELDKKEKELIRRELALKELELQAKNKEIEDLNSEKFKENNSLADIYKTVKSSILLVIAENENDYSLGSCFIISSNGIALTNYHVLSKAEDVVLINENEDVFRIDKILDANETLDYLIFKINTSTTLPYLKIANNTAEIGDECFAIGNPQGLQQTLSKGIISSYRDKNRIIQTTAEITHGSSGGALFNSEGEVIGMTTSGIGKANLNFAININSIPYKNFIDENRESDIELIN